MEHGRVVLLNPEEGGLDGWKGPHRVTGAGGWQSQIQETFSLSCGIVKSSDGIEYPFLVCLCNLLSLKLKELLPHMSDSKYHICCCFFYTKL